MLTYVYQGHLLCEDCGEAIMASLIQSGKAPADIDNPFSYTSRDFPKGPYVNGQCVEDAPWHCTSGEDCIGPAIVRGGVKTGAFLGWNKANHYPRQPRPNIRDPFTDFDFHEDD